MSAVIFSFDVERQIIRSAKQLYDNDLKFGTLFLSTA